MARKKNKAKHSGSFTRNFPKMSMKKNRKQRSSNIVDNLSRRELTGRHTIGKHQINKRMLLIHSDKKLKSIVSRHPNNNQSNGGLQLR
eukprot:SAG31_NODE_31222_length_370_cov_1.712177_1_plen_88_part_00